MFVCIKLRRPANTALNSNLQHELRLQRSDATNPRVEENLLGNLPSILAAPGQPVVQTRTSMDLSLYKEDHVSRYRPTPALSELAVE